MIMPSEAGRTHVPKVQDDLSIAIQPGDAGNMEGYLQSVLEILTPLGINDFLCFERDKMNKGRFRPS